MYDLSAADTGITSKVLVCSNFNNSAPISALHFLPYLLRDPTSAVCTVFLFPLPHFHHTLDVVLSWFYRIYF